MLSIHEDDTVVKCSKRKSISRNSESLDSHIAKCNKKNLTIWPDTDVSFVIPAHKRCLQKT